MIDIRVATRRQMSDAAVVQFLRESYEVIKSFSQVYDLISGDMQEKCDISMVEIGIGYEDQIMFKLAEITGGVEYSALDEAMANNSFGEGGVVVKLMKSIAYFIQLIEEFRTHEALSQPISLADLKDHELSLRYNLGDFVYAVYQICMCDQILGAHISGEEERHNQSFEMFLKETNKDSVEFALELFNLKRKFKSVIPIFKDTPAMWDDITASMDPDLLDSLIDCGEFIFPIDMVAVKRGTLALDEDYLQLLEARSNNSQHVCQLYPDQWLQFQDAVPEAYAADVMAYEEVLTIGVIAPIIEGEPFTEDYMQLLRKLFKDGAAHTDMFGGE